MVLAPGNDGGEEPNEENEGSGCCEDPSPVRTAEKPDPKRPVPPLDPDPGVELKSPLPPDPNGLPDDVGEEIEPPEGVANENPVIAVAAPLPEETFSFCVGIVKEKLLVAAAGEDNAGDPWPVAGFGVAAAKEGNKKDDVAALCCDIDPNAPVPGTSADGLCFAVEGEVAPAGFHVL